MNPYLKSFKFQLFLGVLFLPSMTFAAGAVTPHSRPDTAAAAAIPVTPSAPKLPRAIALKTPPPLSDACRAVYMRYLKGALNGLAAMRDPASGLVRDTTWVKKDAGGGVEAVPYKNQLLLSDYALDILVQVELLSYPEFADEARKNLKRVVESLSKLDRDQEHGLFFWLYGMDGNPVARNLSNVDNVHLAIALAAAAQHPSVKKDLPAVAAKAQTLFNAMDFSPYYDEQKGLLVGNMLPMGDKFVREPYHFHLTSEGRSIYFVARALNLFKNIPDEKLDAALQNADLKVSGEGELLVWDGAVFQSALPSLLLGERNYSRFFEQNERKLGERVFRNYTEAKLAGDKMVQVPQAATASLELTRKTDKGVEFVYSGKLGLPSLKDPSNVDKINNQVVVPHGLMLASAANPCEHLEQIQSLENAESDGVKFFEPQMGWMASATLKSNGKGSSTVAVNPGLVAVDKLMETLAILRNLSPYRMSPSAYAFSLQPDTRAKLQSSYNVVDERTGFPTNALSFTAPAGAPRR